MFDQQSLFYIVCIVCIVSLLALKAELCNMELSSGEGASR
jgi:hypothetical protein